MADKNKFWITDTDKEWIQENYRWLLKVYGYPNRDKRVVLFNKKFFPHTFSKAQVDVESLISDFTHLFKIDKHQITLELVEDIRDSYGMPYEIQGRPFERELFIDQSQNKNFYKIQIAKNLTQHPGQLILNLALSFIAIKLTEHKVKYDTGDDDDADLFLYLAGIFAGYGILLYQNLVDSGISSDAFWQKRWRYVSEMPVQVMAYALALYYDLTEEKDPVWVNDLSGDLKKEFGGAIEFISVDSNPLYNKQELDALDIYREGIKKSKQSDLDAAIACYQKVLFLTGDKFFQADANNGIGYVYLKKREYAKSIPYFQKAFELNPKYGYAYDNLGFAFIMNGDMDSGKYYLNLALQTEKNDPGYSYRNFALYHQKRKEYDRAEEYFQKAFNNIVLPIDLLEFFYAQYLFEVGDKGKEIEYLKKAVDKGEPEAIQLMNTINNTK